MDYDDSIKGKSDSVLEIDRFHFNRIISRESSVGQSSRIYYRNPEGVPFKWEMQPGTPKNPPREEVIPPPSPPPAVQSLWLPKPNCADQSPKDSKHSVSKLWFWKKHKKQVHLKAQRPGDHAGKMRSDKYEHFEFGDSDGEFMGSVQDSRYSASSSSSTNSSNGHSSLHQSRFGKEYDNVVDKPFGCSPWNMTELRVRVARLV